MSAVAIEAAVRAEGLLRPGSATVVLLSGGRSSVCLLDLADSGSPGRAPSTCCTSTTGFRPESGRRRGGAAAPRCARRFGVALHVQPRRRARRGRRARELRYAAAEELARERGAGITAGHTASDQVETVLYRLAASPGRRALLGMGGRAGRLGAAAARRDARARPAAYCAERGLASEREDASNASPG